MKRCPTCQRLYKDETLNFCRDDGTTLITFSTASSQSATLILSPTQQVGGVFTQNLQTNPSIAVLPFVNMSAETENEYFCDGLAEELISALSKIEKLKVAARTSAFSFKGTDVKATEMGKALNVSTLLEGSVRKSGNRLRIIVQLVNVSDGYHLWSERYDRQMEDVFDIQDEITLAVVSALKLKLLGEEKAAVFKRYTDNPDAYELYLKGRYYFEKHTVEAWQRAIEYFEQAIEKDPEYARAYVGMSVCLGSSWFYGLLPPGEVVPKWKAAARRALDIDSDLAEAHSALGQIYTYYEWNWEEAEQKYKRAIELNPNSTGAHQLYGLFLVSRERFDEALGECRRALELDPLSLFGNLQVGLIYLCANYLDKALELGLKMIEMEPTYHGAYWLIGMVYMTKGMYDEAVESLQEAVTLGGHPGVLSVLGTAYALLGKREEALRVLNQLLEMRTQRYVSAYSIARVYSGLGESDVAFGWLEKAYEERNGELVFLRRQAVIGSGVGFGRSVPKDARLPRLLQKIGLPQ